MTTHLFPSMFFDYQSSAVPTSSDSFSFFFHSLPKLFPLLHVFQDLSPFSTNFPSFNSTTPSFLCLFPPSCVYGRKGLHLTNGSRKTSEMRFWAEISHPSSFCRTPSQERELRVYEEKRQDWSDEGQQTSHRTEAWFTINSFHFPCAQSFVVLSFIRSSSCLSNALFFVICDGSRQSILLYLTLTLGMARCASCCSFLSLIACSSQSDTQFPPDLDSSILVWPFLSFSSTFLFTCLDRHLTHLLLSLQESHRKERKGNAWVSDGQSGLLLSFYAFAQISPLLMFTFGSGGMSTSSDRPKKRSQERKRRRRWMVHLTMVRWWNDD